MIFKNDLHSSQGKSERIDWIKGEIKKYTLTEELAKRNVNVINNKIADCLRLLRLSPNTRRDYTDQILLKINVDYYDLVQIQEKIIVTKYYSS